MVTAIECAICSNRYNMMRDHCPTCGAKRVILASHSHEPQRSIVQYYNADRSRQLVRAYRSNYALLTAQ